MVKDKSVAFTYSNENRMKYQKYAEYFQLIGVHVCENIRGKDNILDMDDNYNIDDAN